MRADDPVPTPPDAPVQAAALGLSEELAAVLWYQNAVLLGEPLPVSEAEAVAWSLHLALERAGPERLPQLALTGMNEYLAVHSMNVALLAMALAEHVGIPAGDVRDIGMAALLHDVGMTAVPVDLLSKADQLEEDERNLIRLHPSNGASLIVQAEASLQLAAVVAYEHHVRLDGGGYPELRYSRKPQYASRLVQLCDVYHALHSPRPFRQAWPQDIILSFIGSRAGVEFDPELARSLAEMLKGRTGARQEGAT